MMKRKKSKTRRFRKKPFTPQRGVFQKGTFTATPGIGRDSQLPLFFVHFLLRKRKRTKRNRPRPGALRAALRFSQPAVPVELACAHTATGPLSPAAAMLGPGRWDINRRPQQAVEISLWSSKNPIPAWISVEFLKSPSLGTSGPSGKVTFIRKSWDA